MNPRSIVKLSVVVLVSLGAFGAGAANAQQPAMPDAASPAATHHDPIVQKRSEVREANRQRSAQTSEARRQARQQSREARTQRNQSVQESRQRATKALAASAAQ
jgi:hypothetical protein